MNARGLTKTASASQVGNADVRIPAGGLCHQNYHFD